MALNTKPDWPVFASLPFPEGCAQRSSWRVSMFPCFELSNFRWKNSIPASIGNRSLGCIDVLPGSLIFTGMAGLKVLWFLGWLSALTPFKQGKWSLLSSENRRRKNRGLQRETINYFCASQVGPVSWLGPFQEGLYVCCPCSVHGDTWLASVSQGEEHLLILGQACVFCWERVQL